MFVHDQVFATNDGKPTLILRLLHAYDLIWLSCLSREQFDWNFIVLSEGFRVIHQNLVYFCDQKRLQRHQLKHFGPLEIRIVYRGLNVVNIFSSVYFEALLASLVSNTVFDPTSKHHLRAVHVISHHIFKDGHVSFPVDEIEENLIGRCHLNSNVAFDIVDKPTNSNVMILFPLLFSRHQIFLLFEKEDFG